MSPALSSAPRFEAELVLALKPSPLLRTSILLLHILVIASVWMMPLTWLWKLSLILGIFLLGSYEWRRMPSLGHTDLKQLIWRATGGWEVETNTAKLQGAKLIQHFCTHRLTILHLKTPKRTWVIILLADNLEAIPGQLLRRRLKLLT